MPGAADRVGRWLYLNPGEFGRAWPFFALYLVLFAAFSVADGVALALFVERVGAAALPVTYAAIAAANVVLIGGYVLLADRLGGTRTFALILAPASVTFATVWAVLRWADGGSAWYTVLFVTREVAFTLVLLHFGTYLQGYFTRDELNRVLPVTYAGGRVGGILGGWLLARLSGPLGPLNLIPLFVGLCLAALVVVAVVARRVRRAAGPAEAGVESSEAEREACRSVGAFLRHVGRSPVLFWASAGSVLFMVSRWFLNYQYSHFFGEYFEDPAEFAAFVGRYTQWALAFALAVQLFAVNRLVGRLGVGGAYLLLAAVVGAAAGVAVLPMTLGLAVFCRLVETELRYGVRNPLMQLVTNTFTKPLRVRVRAWTMGVLTPAGTLAASAALGALTRTGAAGCVAWVGLGVAAVHLIAAVGLARALARGSADPPGGRAG